MDRPRVSFVAWSSVGGRSAEIAAALEGEAACFYSLPGAPPALVPLRWCHSALRMILYLMRRRPRALIVTNPPIFPGLIGVTYGRLTGAPVLLDSHPGSFALKGDRVARIMLPVHRWLAPRVAGVMVTVEQLGERVRSWGGRALVVHEAPARRASNAPPGPRDPLEVLFICTFDPDEPVDAVLEAVATLPEVHLTVTGDTRRLPEATHQNAPENVRFVGYLPAEEYARALERCDAVLALTTEPTSIVRAGYEAVYAQRPLVVSDWPALRETFPHAVHVANDPSSIARGLRRACRAYPELRRLTRQALITQQRRWENQLTALVGALPAQIDQPSRIREMNARS
jgi:glycosyltransferase involved in cell wall biosynthesis